MNLHEISLHFHKGGGGGPTLVAYLDVTSTHLFQKPGIFFNRIRANWSLVVCFLLSL